MTTTMSCGSLVSSGEVARMGSSRDRRMFHVIVALLVELLSVLTVCLYVFVGVTAVQRSSAHFRVFCRNRVITTVISDGDHPDHRS